MNIIELARKAGIDKYINDIEERPYLTKLETFARLIIEDFVKGVDVEPVARFMTWVGKGTYPKQGYTVARTFEECHKEAYPKDWQEGDSLFTAEQMAAQRHKALEEAAQECDGRAAYYDQGDDDRPDTRRGRSARACADAIRALNNQPPHCQNAGRCAFPFCSCGGGDVANA